ncbi:MAG TPA: hypothetical protein VJ869_02895 [Sphaerochaeta sp.]|nr:hypothetical protein [Sphaerochaeta sp.]
MNRQSEVFFSSDLMFQMGDTQGKNIESSWEEAIRASGANQLPSIGMQDRLLKDFSSSKPVFVASGHGPCIKVQV